MTSVSITSPTILTFGQETIQCKISHQMYSDNKLGVRLPVNHSVFMILSEKDKNGKYIMPIDGVSIFGKETVQMLNDLKATIGQCSQIAELLFGRLKTINGQFKQLHELAEIFEPYEDKYHKLDFMGHRNLLSAIFKSKRIEWLSEILKEYDLKSVTKSFFTLIMDRNKYTHGELMFWYPENQTVIEYENDARQPEYAVVTSDILNSYLHCYGQLDNLLNKVAASLK
jgi:hypothetical protein